MKIVGNYKVKRTIGRGNFAVVKLVQNIKTKEHYAMKVFSKKFIIKQKLLDNLKREIVIMKMLRHPYINTLYEVLASSKKVYIILELCAGGELFNRLLENGKFSEFEARKYFKQLIEGVEYCHLHGISHRDLKPENLLLDKDLNLKISDFGLSALMVGSDEKEKFVICGSPNYIAPEMLITEENVYNPFSIDIWSCGVILYVFIAGYLPFDESNISTLLRKIISGDFLFPGFFSENAKSLITQILNPDHKKRLSIKQIKESKWWKTNEEIDDPILSKENNKNQLLSLSEIEKSSSTIFKSLDSITNDSDNESDCEFNNLLEKDGQYKKKRKDKGPLSMNAFDVVAMVAGASLHNMFNINHNVIKSYTYFCSSQQPAHILFVISEVLSNLKYVEHIVDHKKLSISIKVDMTDENCKIDSFDTKVKDKNKKESEISDKKISDIIHTMSTSKVIVYILVKIYELGSDIFIVDFSRDRGNTIAFHSFWKRLKLLLNETEIIEN